MIKYLRKHKQPKTKVVLTKTLLLLCFLCNQNSLCAQDSIKSKNKNAIYTKCEYIYGGTGQIGGSINYERKFFDSNLAIGFGAIFYLHNVKGLNIEGNYLFFNNKNHFETGLSYTYIFGSDSGRTGDLYSLILGYRFENLNKKGMSLKLGINPSLMGEYFQRHYNGSAAYYTWPIFRAYFGIGYAF